MKRPSPIHPFAAIHGLDVTIPLNGIVAVALCYLPIPGKDKEACRHGG
ncbi:MAG: hypothetical protein AB1899_02995 [Pseudomonadota bacterium]